MSAQSFFDHKAYYLSTQAPIISAPVWAGQSVQQVPDWGDLQAKIARGEGITVNHRGLVGTAMPCGHCRPFGAGLITGGPVGCKLDMFGRQTLGGVFCTTSHL